MSLPVRSPSKGCPTLPSWPRGPLHRAIPVPHCPLFQRFGHLPPTRNKDKWLPIVFSFQSFFLLLPMNFGKSDAKVLIYLRNAKFLHINLTISRLQVPCRPQVCEQPCDVSWNCQNAQKNHRAHAYSPMVFSLVVQRQPYGLLDCCPLSSSFGSKSFTLRTVTLLRN